MIKHKGFDIILSSDNDYEQMCAEIYYNRQFIAIITQEDDHPKPMITFGPPPTNGWEFDYTDFMATIEHAYAML